MLVVVSLTLCLKFIEIETKNSEITMEYLKHIIKITMFVNNVHHIIILVNTSW